MGALASTDAGPRGTSISPDVARKIRLARERRSTVLDLACMVSSENRLTEIPPEVFEMTWLEVLKLRGNPIKHVPERLRRLVNLTEVDLGFTDLTELPRVLRRLPRLSVLELSGLKFPMPPWLFDLQGLRRLSLSHTGLTEIAPEIARLGRLRSLNLSGNPQLRDAGIDPGWLAGLEELGLWGSCRGQVPEWVSDCRGLRSLNIGDNGLTALPDWLGAMASLEEIELYGNTLESLDPLAPLRRLKIVHAYRCPLPAFPDCLEGSHQLEGLHLEVPGLASIPEWLGRLEHLAEFSLWDSGLTTLPGWVGGLTGLRSLNLSGNPLVAIPEPACRLSRLKMLWLHGCRLESVPDAIGGLVGLEKVSLGDNRLTSLPESFARLERLAELRLMNNLFEELPAAVYELRGLRSLNIENSRYASESSCLNSIRSLSPRFLDLEDLEEFEADGNPWETPPLDVVAGGIDAIREFLRQQEEVGTDHLYEAKLLILGEGGAGKTTLARKLLDPDYELRPQEKSTEGIGVLRWDFPMEDGRTFRVNVWDFGGQEIYHATHQFFLTKRSLYALVADNRKEDTDFFYWLNVVELLSDDSPLIIVKNEKQDRHREINERQLRGEFGNLKEVLATNLATNRGLDQVADEIRTRVRRLPHVGSALPKTWVRVREELENDPRHYIGRDEYFRICDRNGFRRDEDKLQLSEHLHNLGVCLHFQADPLLKNTIILKPSWGTGAVYKVLDSPQVCGNLGRFDRADLARIWSEPEYRGMHDELLQLMKNFRLCYQIPGEDRYIAPQRLTDNQPSYEWDAAANLHMRFKYEFMPKGILSQFIVATHALIRGRDCVWKTGVVLAKDGARAEVVEHHGRNEVRVRVSGVNKRELMVVAAYELEKIHASYSHRLRFDQLIPCNCEVCRGDAEPHFYPVRVLRQFLADRQPEIQCTRSYRMVEVVGLIDDVAGRVATPEPEAAGANPRASVHIPGTVGTLIINQGPGGGADMARKRPSAAAPSAWVNGSFYLALFAVIIAGMAVLSKTAPWYAFPMALLAALVFVPMIGVIETYRSGLMVDRTFLQVLRLVIAQLPLVGSMARTTPPDAAEGAGSKPKPEG